MLKLPNIKLNVFICFLIILAGGFFLGWMIRGKNSTNNYSSDANVSITKTPPLRLDSGQYKFISPLLACDATPDKESPELQTLENKLNDLIQEKVQENDITTAAVYFRDFKEGSQLVINKDEKFFPASLGKIPVMIAYLKAAELKPEILENKIVDNVDQDFNAQQEIKSSNYIKNGQTYTIEELLEKMIQESDNNALALLSDTPFINSDMLKSVYNDLKVSYFPGGANQQNPDKLDFMTVESFTYFLRVLYNGTYLYKSYSEKALQILSDVDFKDGLVAGIPKETLIAHKFGLESVSPNGTNVVSRELHDCGIIYYPQNPYVICVMTKSTSDLTGMKNAIKDISKLVYNEVENRYK